jgi:eukaryotic-like serine/threonine-protein kinase
MSESDFRWERLWSVFHEVREAAPGERKALLERLTPDAQLRGEIEELLAAESASAALLDSPPPVVPSSEETSHLLPGQTIGPYHLLSVLGRGGMGVVFEAEQSEPVRRRVALKLLTSELLSPGQRIRFEAERQALALMDHAHIARVYDAGTTGDGRPWLVMERVDGVPLTDHCDAQRLDIASRVELMITVCEAIQHAHQRGVIHRDLKPSNVLVTTAGGAPAIKVIDFGVAKGIGQRLSDQSLATLAGTVLGTPEYMSPEQASFQKAIDTRSDVYSLGVMLYECLAGVRPHRSNDESLLAYLERIRNEEVPSPVRRLRGLSHDEIDEIARRRSTTPAALQRLLTGELDWILTHALERDPDRRYGSAGELAADLRRHLAGEPVIAAPVSGTYRLRKVVRRHRGFVTAAAIIALTLVGGIIGTSRMAALARLERDRAQQALAEAKRSSADAAREAEIARATSGFVQDLISSPDPWRSASRGAARDTKVVDILARARNDLDARVGGHPEVASAIRVTLARTYMNLGMFDDAGPLLEQSIEELVPVVGDRHPAVLSARHDLGTLQKRRGRYDEAERLIGEVLEMRRLVLGENDPNTFASEGELAEIQVHNGKLAVAEEAFRDLLPRMTRALGPDNRQTLSVRNNLAIVLNRLGKNEESETHYLHLLDARRRLDGSDHPDAINTLNNYASLVQGLGRVDEAIGLFRQVVEATSRVLGPRHERSINTRNNLAVVLYRQRNLDEAETQFREVIPGYDETLGPEHPTSLSVRNNLARVLLDRGNVTEAAAIYRELLPVAERVHPPSHPMLATYRLGYGMTLEALGRRGEAKRHFELTYGVFLETYGRDDERTKRAEARLRAVQ